MITERLRLSGTFRDHQPFCAEQIAYQIAELIRLLRALSSLSISKDRDTTPSSVKLFQCLGLLE